MTAFFYSTNIIIYCTLTSSSEQQYKCVEIVPVYCYLLTILYRPTCERNKRNITHTIQIENINGDIRYLNMITAHK